MPELTVAPAGPEELDAFHDVALRVREGDAGFAVPFREAERGQLLGRGPFASPGVAVQPFLARRGGEPAGRVAAIAHPDLRDEGGLVVGQIGFYECADDPEAAAGLLAAAEAWLRRRGCAQVLGPIDGGAHRAHRLMVKGFEAKPHLLEPRTPARYADHFRAAGFAPAFRWTAHEPGRLELAALGAAMDRLSRKSPYRLVPLDERDPAKLLPRLHPLLDRAFSGSPGHVSFSLAEAGAVLGGLVAVLPPTHLQLLQDPRGRDVGFGYVVPDWFEEVRALRGDGARFGHWAGGPLPSRCVLHTVALAPEARNGVGAAMLVGAGCRVALEGGYDRFLMALTREDFRAHVRHLPATREYVLLRKVI
jgi:hypothetical protein